MSSSSGIFFKDKDGAYVAADSTDIPRFSWFEIMFKVVWQVLWNIPNFAIDFIYAFVWTPKKSLKDSLVLVSGGAHGLGRAICVRLAHEGCHVAVADNDEAGAKRTADEIKKLGLQASSFRVDVSDFISVQQLRQQVERDLGSVDILVNNAGLLSNASISDGSNEDLRKIIDVNLLSHYWMTREFKPAMLKKKGGHIVGISSILGFCATSTTNAYSATQFGIRAMMDSLHEEFYLNKQDRKLFTTCVYPCLISTRKDIMKKIKEMGVRMETMTPNQAASIIVKGIRQNKKEIILGSLLLQIVLKLHALLPTRLRYIITRCMVVETGPAPARAPVPVAPVAAPAAVPGEPEQGAPQPDPVGAPPS